MRRIITSSALALGAVVAAAVFTAPQPAFAQRGDAICLQTESGSQDCSYLSMQQCLQSRTGPADTCALNQEYEGGTVGFGGATRSEGAPILGPQAQPDYTR